MFERLRTRRLGSRVAIGIVVLIAFVSIATGVGAILTEPTVRVSGFLATIESIAAFSGTIIGFVLLVTAWGMQRGYRLAYVAAAVLVFLGAAHGIAQLRLLSVPLVVLSIGGLAVLVLTSGRFTRRVSISTTQVGALAAILGVVCYGTAGTYALQSGFNEVETVFDALYFTLVTATTVGYGDIYPLTAEARLFVISLVILGPATIAATAGSLFGPILKAQLSKVDGKTTDSRSTDRENHVVVLGYSELAKPIISELADRAALVIVTDDDVGVEQLGVDADVIAGDPVEKETLRRANIEDATAVVVVTERKVTPHVVLAVRAVRSTVHLVAVTNGDDTETLERLGADVVINPQMVLGSVTVEATLDTGDD